MKACYGPPIAYYICPNSQLISERTSLVLPTDKAAAVTLPVAGGWKLVFGKEVLAKGFGGLAQTETKLKLVATRWTAKESCQWRGAAYDNIIRPMAHHGSMLHGASSSAASLLGPKHGTPGS